jgi:cystathionine beta-lyase
MFATWERKFMTETVTFDFDTVIDRRGTNCAKWDLVDEDVIPLPVADMDFKSPPAVLEALHTAVEHGVFGYTPMPGTLKDTLVERMKQLYDWDITPEDIFFVPGVVIGVNLVTQGVVQDNAFLMHTPAYHPFHRMPIWNGCSKQETPLRYVETETGFTYKIDFDAFEAAITPETRMFLLCNPHNPVGRVWSAAELEKLAEIALRHDLMICSDEIHSDLLLNGTPHTPIATLSPEIAQRTVTFIAPSKTFNLPGLKFSVGIVQNPELREKLIAVGDGLVFESFDNFTAYQINMLGYLAGDAAYKYGEPWLRALLDYLRENLNFARDYIRQHMPELKTADLEGTYLLWIDCREANLPDLPGKWFLENARVMLNEGQMFGAEGEGFVRLNLGTSRVTLEQALERMRAALENR